MKRMKVKIFTNIASLTNRETTRILTLSLKIVNCNITKRVTWSHKKPYNKVHCSLIKYLFLSPCVYILYHRKIRSV